MDIKQQILHLYRVEERSMRDISRTLGVDRKTVTRLINAYEAKIQEDPESGIDEFLAQTPKYKERQYAPRIMKEVIAKQIDTYLKENDRRCNNGMRKQCMKRKDIHRALLEKGFAVSYSSVCTYIRDRRSEAAGKSKDVYLRIHHEPGVECEFDWGEVKLFFRREMSHADDGRVRIPIQQGPVCISLSPTGQSGVHGVAQELLQGNRRRAVRNGL